MIDIHLGDCVKWAREYEGEPYHALLCDPPYHLTSITKRFGGEGSAPAQFGKDGAFSRASAGFMGKKWDGGDVAFDPETWAAFLKILHPGAFGMAFASSRGWHRLAVAIEDAGFVIHPSIFGWLYGSGFPKATRVNHGDPNTETFQGHRYGLQALKPALEPIIVFQKPYEGRPVANITATGAGCLNVDGGRIPTDDSLNGGSTVGSHGAHEGWRRPWMDREEDNNAAAERSKLSVAHAETLGRWPANFIIDEFAARRLDEQSGERQGNFATRGESKAGQIFGYGNDRGEEPRGYGDSGGASRFFFNVKEQLDEADPVKYMAKASRSERDAGLEGMPKQAVPDFQMNKNYVGSDGVLSPQNTPAHNPHPTVKPLSLSRYLATLLLPPVEYAPRRIFIPFAGVASECIGSMQAGWEEIVGVELTEEYLPIAKARVEYWSKQGIQRELSGMSHNLPKTDTSDGIHQEDK